MQDTWPPASLNADQIDEIKKLEEKLGIVLIAYQPMNPNHKTESQQSTPTAMRAYDRYLLNDHGRWN